MARNLYFSDAVRSEQELYENIIIESLKMYGQDVYYLPRDLVNEDKVFGDDVTSRFNSSYKVEMYVENTDGFDGEGDLFTKFGVEIRDQATFVIARRRWSDTVLRYDNEITGTRPREGDLIYLPMSRSMFQIMAVEHEQPFYQLRDLPTYKLRCELFEYTSEEFDTEVDAIDAIEKDFAYQYQVVFTQSTATATASLSSGSLDSFTVDDGGSNYPSAPLITFSNEPYQYTAKWDNDDLPYGGSNSLYPANTLTDTNLTQYTNSYTSNSSRGSLSFWLYVNNLPSSGNFSQIIVTGLDEDKAGSNTTTKSVLGLNSDGKLVSGEFFTGLSPLVLDNQVDAPVIQEDQWHHVTISLRGPLTGATTRTTQVYIDGTLTYRADGITQGTYDGDYTIGGSTASGVDAITTDYALLDGFIDDFLVVSTQPNILDVVDVPTEPRSGNELNNIAYESFDTPRIRATATITDGEVTAITFNSNYNHDYFVNPPNVYVAAPTELAFQPGETIAQVLSSGAILNGKANMWKKSTNTLTIQQLGSNDGKYHEISTTARIIGELSGETATPSSITEVNTMSSNEDNDDFESEADDILDFTETNPFGDPNEA